MQLEYSTVGLICWGCTCLAALAVLLLLKQQPSNGFCFMYSQYFLCHVVLSLLVVISDLALHVPRAEEASGNGTTTAISIPKKQQSTALFLEWGIAAVLTLGATVYWRFGVIWITDGIKVHVHFWVNLGFMLLAVVLLLQSIAILILKGETRWMPLVTWLYYSVYALAAMIGLGRLIYLKVNFHYRREEPVTSGRVACERVKPHVLIAGFFGLLAGMLNFQLPYFDALRQQAGGPPLWEVVFVTRVLDCVLYIPPFVACILWLDNPCNFRMQLLPGISDALLDNKINIKNFDTGETTF